MMSLRNHDMFTHGGRFVDFFAGVLKFLAWVFMLYCWIRVVLKTGFSTGTIILVILLPPLGLVWLAFADWPSMPRRKHRPTATEYSS